MNINATLLGQALWFALFIWLTMKYVWPPLQKAMQDRQKEIADGLAAGEKGRQELAEAAEKGYISGDSNLLRLGSLDTSCR